MKKLRKEQWIALGLIVCVLGIVAGCVALRRSIGSEKPQNEGVLDALQESVGETQQVSPQVKKACRAAPGPG